MSKILLWMMLALGAVAGFAGCEQKDAGDHMVQAGQGLCALYYTDETHLSEAVSLVEDAFRLSAKQPEPRDLVLDLVQ